MRRRIAASLNPDEAARGSIIGVAPRIFRAERVARPKIAQNA